MKKIIKDRDDIVFYIKMFPIRSHPHAYKKSKAIVCEQSLKLLDDAFAGKSMPEPSCETSEVDDNIALAESLGISATPTIILPDGAIVSGYKDANTLVDLIKQAGESIETADESEAAAAEEMKEPPGETPEEMPEEATEESKP